MTGHKPRLQFAARDLYDSFELHVMKISKVACGVDGGLRDLQEGRYLGDGKEAVIRDAADDGGGQGAPGWRQSSVSSAVDSGCIGLQNCPLAGSASVSDSSGLNPVAAPRTSSSPPFQREGAPVWCAP